MEQFAQKADVLAKAKTKQAESDWKSGPPADVALPFAVAKISELQSPDVASLLEIQNASVQRLAKLLRDRALVLEPGTVDVLHSLYKKLRSLKGIQQLLEAIDAHPGLLSEVLDIVQVLAKRAPR